MEKFAKVVHSMRAQLAEEIDLEEGDIVKIVEIVDKDWYRGECKGRSGTFPSSFVRVIDAFPGCQPPPDADVSSYLDAERHKHNEYQNTRDTFASLEEGLKRIGRETMIKNVVNGLPEELVKKTDDPAAAGAPVDRARDPSIPKEIFEDDYFRRNLPATYGSTSVDLGDDDDGGGDGGGGGGRGGGDGGGESSSNYRAYDAERSIFGAETERCSRGFQDMSENLKALHWRRQSEETAAVAAAAAISRPYYSYGKTSLEMRARKGKEEEAEEKRSASLTPVPDYSRLSENLNVFKATPSSSNGSAGGDGSSSSSSFGLTPAADYNQLARNLSVFNNASSSSSAIDSAPHASSLDYNRLSENLSVFEKSIDTTSSPFSQFRPPKREKANDDPLRPAVDYNKVSENLRVLGKKEEEKEERRGAFAYQVLNKNLPMLKFSEIKLQEIIFQSPPPPFQTVTCEGMGYTGERVDVKPYAIARFNFVAEFDNELGLNAGEMVYLNRYVDKEWLEGEVDSQKGMFPINYVNIIVDCNQADSTNVISTR